MSGIDSAQTSDWDEVRQQVDELRAVLPSLSDLPDVTPDNVARVLHDVADETEKLRRRVIRDRILRASLQELMGALLRSRDPDATLDQLTSYLHQVLGVDEVLLVRRRGRTTQHWLGYYASTGRPERFDLRDWVAPTGETRPDPDNATPATTDPDSSKTGPEHYAYVLPLCTEEAERGAFGYLCMNAGPEMDEDWSPSEIARRVAGMIQTLEHREELERSDRFRRQLLEAMQDGVLAINANGTILEANASLGRFFGLGVSDLLGMQLTELPSEPLVRHLRMGLEKKSAPPSRELVLESQGRRVPVSVAVSDLHDAKDQFRGMVVNLTDLSPIRAMEEEIDRLDRLAAIGRFAAGVAHEVRNPLAGIGAGVEYLSKSFAKDADEQEDIRFVVGEVRRLNDIVCDLLDYTQPRPLQCEPVPATDMANRVRTSLTPLAKEHEVELRLVGDSTASVYCDPGRLEQVLLNLARNGIEASPQGSIVSVRWQEDRERNCFRFLVEDEGPGLSEEAIRRAAEPFFTTKGSGTGLGLYLSHSIVEQHGGRLEFGNRSDQGASISVEIPLAEQERTEDNAVVHLDH